MAAVTSQIHVRTEVQIDDFLCFSHSEVGCVRGSLFFLYELYLSSMYYPFLYIIFHSSLHLGLIW